MAVSQLSAVLRDATDGMLLFWCPGCDGAHGIPVVGRIDPSQWVSKARWGWNGSIDKPTFTPSILVSGTEMTEAGEADYAEWMAAGHPAREGKAFDSRNTVCHSFVTDGRIQFLGDCTHVLAGQTVELPPWDRASDGL
ncbi:MAG: DUF6527 family protein [Burkholderiaceae bacterium]